MASILATTTTKYHTPRDDHKTKEERYALSDGRHLKLQTFTGSGTLVLAHMRAADGAWLAVPVKEARRILQEARKEAAEAPHAGAGFGAAFEIVNKLSRG